MRRTLNIPDMNEGGMDSLKDIADRLNVSQSTVSRALSGAKGVSKELRERIVDAARKSHYSPNSLASFLRTGRGRGLTMLVQSSRSGIAIMRDELLFLKAKRRFGGVKMIAFDDGDESLRDAIALAAADKPSAIAVSGFGQEIPQDSISLLERREIPVVAINLGGDGTDRIGIDCSSGTFQMARLLLLTGAKSPVFLSSYGRTLENPDGRISGIAGGMNSVGMELLPERIVQIEHREDATKEGFEAAERIMKTMYADAIFCYNDFAAIGVVRSLLKRGVRVPGDVKVVGFDDMPFAEYLPVSLTTIAQPLEMLVDAALEMIERRLKEFDAPPQELSLKTSLVVRESAPLESHSIREEVFREFDAFERRSLKGTVL